jgi:RRXRR protein
MHSRELWGKGDKERPSRAGCVIRSMGAYTATKDRLTHRSTRRPYFWTSLASNLYFRTHYDAKGTESDAFGAIASSVKWGFCGQTMPPTFSTTKHIGMSATTEQAVLFEEEAQPRTDMQEVLAARRQFRYARRNRKPGIVLVGCSTEESRRAGLPFPFGIWSKRI